MQENQEGDQADEVAHGGAPTPIDYVVAEFLRIVSGGRVNWDITEGTLNGIPFEDYTKASDPYWWVARAIEFPKDFETFVQELVTNPEEALQSYFDLLFFDYPEHIPQLFQALNQSPQLLAVALGTAVSNLGAVTGLRGLSGLAAIQPAAIPAVVAPPVASAGPMFAGRWNGPGGRHGCARCAGSRARARDEHGGRRWAGTAATGSGPRRLGLPVPGGRWPWPRLRVRDEQ